MGNHSAPASERERIEVEAVLASDRFSRSPRLAKLFGYLCQKYLDGEAEQIKEYNIATEVLGRPPDFDPSQDAIARVEAHRLRKKLKEYYAAEGAHHEVKIVLHPGTYVPVFTRPRTAQMHPRQPFSVLSAPAAPLNTDIGELVSQASSAPAFPEAPEHRPTRKRNWLWLAIAAGMALATVSSWKFLTQPATASPSSIKTQVAPRALPEIGAITPGHIVRILAGCAGKGHTDPIGDVWQCDRYFSGGRPGTSPHEFLWRTNDPMLFQNIRTGEFSYNVPLAPGSYELHLFFVETLYGPGMITGGGENSRTFLVKLNGQNLLDNFDVLSDSIGPNIADERVFRDVNPASDGKLHLEFISERGQPIVNAIEIVPGSPGRQLPIRLVTQRTSYTDHEGQLWMPDTFYSGGQTSIHKDDVTGTPDPDLYAGERYGNFSYAIPTDTRDFYTVTLHFAEVYWGSPQAQAGSGAGSRIFNVNCNGVRLLENLDIYREVGRLRAMTKTFHHLKPNAQGKLILSFEPVVNYASVYAIEVEDEGN